MSVSTETDQRSSWIAEPVTGPRLVVLAGVAASLTAIAAGVAYTGNAAGERGVVTTSALAVGLPFAVGLVTWSHLPYRRFAPLLMGGALATFVAALSTSDEPVPYSIGRIGIWLAEYALIYLILAFPDGHLRTRVDRVLVALTGALIASLYLPTVLLAEQYPDPSIWSRCAEGCPANAFDVVRSEPGVVDAVILPLREAITAAIFLAVAAVVLLRIRGATSLMRRTLIPVLITATIHTVALPVGLALRRAGHDDGFIVGIVWLLALGMPLVAVGFLAGTFRWRLAISDALQAMAPRMREPIDHDELRTLISEALDDPTVEIAYWLPAAGRWVDGNGRPIRVPPSGSAVASTEIGDDDGPVAAILHDTALCDQQAFIEAVGAFVVLALANQRLATKVEASLRDLHRSRERIAAAADDERRRIERDLHDGAQQRLVALRIKLELASELAEDEGSPGADQLRRLGDEVGEALDDVRSLSAGVYPALLTDRGLADALSAVARSSPIPTTITADGVGRQTPEVESAVYFCCVEALQNAAKHAEGARAISVDLANHGSLRFEVRDDGVGFDQCGVQTHRGLTNMQDRVRAIGGELEIDSARGAGTRVIGTIPGSALAVARSSARRSPTGS